LAVQLEKAECVPVGRKTKQSGSSRSVQPIPPAHERPQSEPVVCKKRSGENSELSPARPTIQRTVPGSRGNDPVPPARSALRSERFWRRDGIPVATSGKA